MLPLQALVLEAEERMEGHGETLGREAAFFEVTIASVDQPKLLSRLSEALVRAGVKSLDGHAAQDQTRCWVDAALLSCWSHTALLSCWAKLSWLRRWAV